VQRIFARIFPNLPEGLLCDFCLQIFFHEDHEDLFFYDMQKNGLSFVFLQMLGAIFCSQTTLGAIFARIGRDFAQIFRALAQILRDFSQILDTSKLTGCACTPCTPASYTTCFA